jgi:hypothetical protein
MSARRSMNGTDPKFVLGVRSVWSHQTEDVGQAASDVGFDASIFVQQQGRVGQFLRYGSHRLSLDFILFESRQFLVQGLSLACSRAANEGKHAQADLDFFVKLDSIRFNFEARSVELESFKLCSFRFSHSRGQTGRCSESNTAWRSCKFGVRVKRVSDIYTGVQVQGTSGFSSRREGKARQPCQFMPFWRFGVQLRL